MEQPQKSDAWSTPGSVARMACSVPNVAIDADDGEAVELEELLSLVSLAKEEGFAVVTPRLQVIGIVGVLDEANGAIDHLQVMPADDGRAPFAVGVATDHHGPPRRPCRHRMPRCPPNVSRFQLREPERREGLVSCKPELASDRTVGAELGISQRCR